MGCALYLILAALHAQALTLGAKGGVLIYQASDTSEVGIVHVGRGPSTTNVRRYTLGPWIEIGLPFRFRIEADVLYRRFSRTESFESIGRIDRLSGNDWQFPLLLKFQDSRGRLKPFVSAGAALRHVWGLQGSTESFFNRPVIPPTVSRYPVSAEKNIQAGLVFAGGVRYRMGPIAVLPEIRYTRWTSIYLQPGRHQLEFLLGLAR